MKNRLKPLPYVVLQDGYPHQQQAEWLRKNIGPKLKRKLPNLYYGGWRHGFVPQWVNSYKKDFPCFFVADIAHFYVSLPHHTLMVCGQLAYKYCVGTQFVPKHFSQSYVCLLQSWFTSLPTANIGIPLASKMSAALSPLFWVPLLREYKQNDALRFLVFADDILVLSRNTRDLEKAYFNLQNYVEEHNMQLNLKKLQQGKLGSTSMQFCGYKFAGGYVSIADSKIKNFKSRVETLVLKHKKYPQILLKRLNHLIKGFGHYYKYGNVKKIYNRLDSFIRHCIRKSLKISYPKLKKYGYHLYNLEAIWEGTKANTLQNTKKKPLKSIGIAQSKLGIPSTELLLINENLQHLVRQQKEIIGLIKKHLKYPKQILVNLDEEEYAL